MVAEFFDLDFGFVEVLVVGGVVFFGEVVGGAEDFAEGGEVADVFAAMAVGDGFEDGVEVLGE